ncbi:hypothetical protein OROMI_002083 [Orobanche minor]
MPSSSGGGDYRKDREEWSDTAIACLLEIGAAMVSERCQNQAKSVEQCKNKVDNLKKRYKLERHRLGNGSVSVSHWPWFNQMEQIVGNSIAAKSTAAAAEEEEKSPGGGGASYSTRQYKRMMATVMNSVLLQSVLEKLGVQTRVQNAFSMPEVVEPYCRQRAIRHLEKGRVVIFGGIGAGMGNPLFSTDTAAALRASEIHADAVLKGTNVDCVYVCDSRNNNSIAAEHISFREFASRGEPPMDIMALTFCEQNRIPGLEYSISMSLEIYRGRYVEKGSVC